MTITKDNVEHFFHNNKVVTKRLCQYNIDDKYKWCKTKTESIYCIMNEVYNEPKCECGKPTKYLSYSVGYQKFCSNKCSNNDKTVIEKQSKNTNWKEMGKALSKTLSLKTTEEINTRILKAKQTKLKLYNDENYNNREQAIQTTFEKYGVKYVMQRDDFKDKVKNTQYLKYGGFFNPSQFTKTNIEKYGVEYPLQNKDVAKKFSKQLRVKYNADKCKEGFVYIIYFKSINLVKIGVTSNMKKRSKQLNKDFGEFEILSITFFDDAYKEERKLHTLYDDYNVVLSEGVGKTEFFQHSIISKLMT
jgi:hypothetical protein